MDNRSKIIRNIWLYLLSTALLNTAAGVVWVGYENTGRQKLELIAFGLLGMGLVGIAAAIVEAWHYRLWKIEKERDRQRQEALRTPEIAQTEAYTATVVAITELAGIINKMHSKRVAVLAGMSPVIFDNLTMFDEETRYYTRDMAWMVIDRLSNEEYRRVYLPVQHGLKSGGRLQKLIKFVTDDLIAVGAAVRDAPNQTAYLIVSKDEAFEMLFAKEEDN